MIEVYTDGASKGNPGPSGAGIFIKDGTKHYSYSIPLGVMSNHEAEFHAVIHALTICEKSFPGRILSIRSDSQLVVDIIDKTYTKNKTFLPLLALVKEKSTDFPYLFIKWIPQNTNKHADQLARKAIHTT